MCTTWSFNTYTRYKVITTISVLTICHSTALWWFWLYSLHCAVHPMTYFITESLHFLIPFPSSAPAIGLFSCLTYLHYFFNLFFFTFVSFPPYFPRISFSVVFNGMNYWHKIISILTVSKANLIHCASYLLISVCWMCLICWNQLTTLKMSPIAFVQAF